MVLTSSKNYVIFNYWEVGNLYGLALKDKRRVKDDKRKTYQIKQLWNLSNEILRLSVLGLKGKRIAEYLGCTPETVSNTINSDLGKAKLLTMRGARDAETIDVATEIKKMVPKALDTYEEILKADDERISFSLRKVTADKVVELGGYEPPKKHLVGHFDIDEIEALKVRGKELAKVNGAIIDLEKDYEDN